MDLTDRSGARMIAPAALVVFFIAMLVILATGGGGGHTESSSKSTGAEKRDLKLDRRRARGREPAPRRTTRTSRASVYVVRTGDTLGGIADKTGVPIAKLQELNPNLDPQALVSGQRIKLR